MNSESQNIEYKESWHDDYLKWICGFANAQGGTLYVGIDDNGGSVGVRDAKKLLEDLPNKIRDALGIIATVNIIQKDNIDVLEIKVPSYNVPISCKGAFYIRSGATNQKLTGLELEHFIMRKRGATWDNSPLPIFTEKDISENAIEAFKKRAVNKSRINQAVLNENTSELLKKLHLVNNGYLTNAAMLLFSDDPEIWQLGAYIKIGYFESDADLIYQDEIHGPLLEQADRAIEVLHLKYMKAMISYEGLQRVERYFVPQEALREALLNAICHKDYSSGIPIQVSVYKDKLYIANCGHLPENLTVSKLMSKHSSEPFNPQIAHVFYLAGMIESWGRGIEKICEACQNGKSNLPVYTINNRDLMVKFSAIGDWSDDTTNDTINDSGSELPTVEENCGKNERDLKSDTINGEGLKSNLKNESDLKSDPKVFELIKENSFITIQELCEKTKMSRSGIKKVLAKLKNENKIVRIGAKKNGHWEIIPK